MSSSDSETVIRRRTTPERLYLTKTVVDGARPHPTGGRDRLIYDTDRGKQKGVHGFGLQVKPSGHKAYFFQYENSRVELRRMTLGRVGELTIQQARKRAKDEKLKVGEGRDPLADRQEERRKAREGVDPEKVHELCDDWLKKHAKRVKRSWREDNRRIEKHVKPAFGSVRIERVTRGRIETLLFSIGGRPGDEDEGSPYESNRVRVLLRTLFRFAKAQGYVPKDFENPTEGIEPYPEEARQRILKREERPKLLEAIEKEPNVYHRGLFMVLAVSGLRKREWLGARYRDLDLKDGWLHLSKTKSGRQRVVPLSKAALAIIRDLPRCVGNDHLFPAHWYDRNGHMRYREEERPMSDPKRQWRRVRKAAGCSDLRMHDLRRTASNTMMRKLGNPKAVQLALGHADPETTLRHYVLAEEEVQREGVDAVAADFLGEGS